MLMTQHFPRLDLTEIQYLFKISTLIQIFGH